MNYDEFLTRVIDEGIEAVKEDYKGDSPAKKLKREGSIKGFEECRGKSPDELSDLRIEACRKTQKCYREQTDDYWFWRCRDAEVEWVCNVVSAAMENSGVKGVVPVTALGMKKAASILGVDGGVLIVTDEKPGK
jgi:hypothetical protein